MTISCLGGRLCGDSPCRRTIALSERSCLVSPRVALCGGHPKEDPIMQDLRVSRRRLMQLAVMGAAGLVASARALPAGGAPVAGAARRDPDAILRDLLDGNRRFAGGQAAGPRRKPEDFATLADGQTPE